MYYLLLCRYNLDVFCDEEYAPATVAEQPLEAQQQDHPSTVNTDISAQPQRKRGRSKENKQ